MCSLPERFAALPAVLLAAAFAGSAAAAAAEAGHYGYGRAPTPQELAGWDIDVRPDGAGLPPGSGSVEQGGEVYAAQCAGCHGTFGEGSGRFPTLAGGEATLTKDRPDKTVGSYWPFVTTLFDYINRAQPYSAPHSLSANDVYAVAAYVLNLNNIVGNNFVADPNTLPKVNMPNRDRFIWKDPRPDTSATECMKNCGNPQKIKIVSSAEGKKVTPRTTGPLDEMKPK
jgi:S-disulfanyl-L-cysteine oxidoreductase SoxD